MKARRTNLREVRARLDAIRTVAVAGDDEHAHGLEDALWRDVLHTIVTAPNGSVFALELAHEALRSRRIKFRRNCA